MGALMDIFSSEPPTLILSLIFAKSEDVSANL